MGLLKRTTVFIGWLSGSVAGLGALLYAAGYLVTRAHLHLLGLDPLLVPGTQQFIEEGANFFIVTGQVLIHDWLSLAAVALAAAVIALAVYLVLSLCAFPGARLVTGGASRCRTAWTRLHTHLPWAPDVTLYLVLLAVLYAHVLEYLERFLEPLGLSNLLYEGVGAAAPPASMRAKLQRWLLDDSTGRLGGHYADLMLGTLEAALFVALAWWVTRCRARRALLVAPFLVVFVLYLAYLPRLFGVLVHSTTYNRIVLRGNAPAAADCLFLLHKTDDEFVVWNAYARTVLWVPKASLQGVEIRGARALFKRQDLCD